MSKGSSKDEEFHERLLFLDSDEFDDVWYDLEKPYSEFFLNRNIQ